MTGFEVGVHGCRGSVPVSGPQYCRYGGATTCFEVSLGDDHRLLIDMGTGALRLHDDLPLDRPLRFSVFLTHLHWDHTQALPFFKPLYGPHNRFDFYGHPAGGLDMEEALDLVMRPPWFPVNFRSLPAQRRFHDLEERPVEIEGFHIIPDRLHHPDGVTAYRIERNGSALVIATDTEHGDPRSDGRLLELARGADVLVYDAQYLPLEYETEKVGWGHSTWREAVTLAKEAGVGRLILTSHDPSRSDDEVDAIADRARAEFAATEAAYEGMTFRVG